MKFQSLRQVHFILSCAALEVFEDHQNRPEGADVGLQIAVNSKMMFSNSEVHNRHHMAIRRKIGIYQRR